MKKVRARYASLNYFPIITLFVAVLGFPGSALAQQPFSVDQLVNLLQQKVAEADLKKQVEQYKVSFELTTENMRALIKAGASDELLKVIENNSYQELIITSPKNDEEAGASIRIQGRSRKFPGKHLWVFVQRRGLNMWWPQGGEARVEDNGEWTQGAFIGQPPDVGFKFDVVAKWVNEKTHNDLIVYLQTGEKTGRYPGISLPDGSPEARVTVRKTTP